MNGTATIRPLLRGLRRYLSARNAAATGQRTDAEVERIQAEEVEIQAALIGLIDDRFAVLHEAAHAAAETKGA